MPKSHEVEQVYQRSDEQIAYALDVSANGTLSSVGSVELFASTDYDTNLTAKLSGSATDSGDTITSPKVIDLVDGSVYRLLFTYTLTSGNVLADYYTIICRDNE